MTSAVWVDASSGASGDMLLAALWDLGVPAAVMAEAAAAVAPVRLEFFRQQRHGFAIARATVHGLEADPPHRTWADIRTQLATGSLPPQVRALAEAAFGRLARAEGKVHGVSPESVHFHEVGAHDAIGDIVGVCAGFTWLNATVTVGPIALGAGTVTSAHGVLSVPGPAVIELLQDTAATVYGGPSPHELCTPTGAALLLTVASAFGDLPTMLVTGSGSGGGTRVLPDRLGALRLIRGSAAAAHSPEPGSEPAVVLATNVDDLDPRIWPMVLARLLSAGAADAWLTPILMKKGRPAHTLQVLAAADPAVIGALQQIVFTHTSAIGLRTSAVTKTALTREFVTVDVLGQGINVKLARHHGRLVNAEPEYDEVAATAENLNLPVKQLLAQARVAALEQASGRAGEGLTIGGGPPAPTVTGQIDAAGAAD